MHKWKTQTTPNDAKPRQKTMYDKSVKVKSIVENNVKKKPPQSNMSHYCFFPNKITFAFFFLETCHVVSVLCSFYAKINSLIFSNSVRADVRKRHC